MRAGSIVPQTTFSNRSLRFGVATFAIIGLATTLGWASDARAESVEAQSSKQVVGEVRAYNWAPPEDLWAPPADPLKALRSQENGTWSHEIRVDGAAFLKPYWSRMDLRRGYVLRVLDVSGREVERFVGGKDTARRGFWGLSSPGDSMTFELSLGSDTAGQSSKRYDAPPFQMSRLAVGDADAWAAVSTIPSRSSLEKATASKSICDTADFTDAICHQGDAGRWAAAQATAGILEISGDGVFFCTGVNISPRNMVLTTESCLPDSAACSGAEFVFGYHRETCGSGNVVDTWQSYRCSETLTSSPFGNMCDPDTDNLDFALHQVDGDPATDWGFVDPDPTPLTSGEALYIFQHAAGRPLELSEGSGMDVEVDGMTLRYYGTLDTESSSTGAPIFRDSDDRLVGLHHCGGCSTPGVGNRGVRMEDIKPLIAAHLCTESLQLEPASSESASQVSGEEFGNGDGVLDPGETWQFVPRVRNVSCGSDAGSVTATFAAAALSADIQLLDTTSTFGSVSAGTTVAGTPVRFTLQAASPCEGVALVDWTQLQSAEGGFSGEVDYADLEVGEVPTVSLLSESFDSGIPMTWTVEHMGTGSGVGSTWTTDDPGSRSLFATPFAIVDSEFLGPGFTMDERLISPPTDTTAYSAVTLRLTHNFRWFDGEMDEKAVVEARSTATGNVWTQVLLFQGADASGTVEADLSAYSDVDLELRFRYYDAEWEWWWALDDVVVFGDDGRRCSTGIFIDGFESGDTSAWSSVVP